MNAPHKALNIFFTLPKAQKALIIGQEFQSVIYPIYTFFEKGKRAMFMTEDRHVGQHAEQLQWMRNMIVDYRDEVGLESSLAIDTQVVCPEEMPTQEGMVIWDREVSYAKMVIRCDLPLDLRKFVVLHECYELLLWETADIYMTTNIRAKINQQFARYLQECYRAARNRQIELLVYRHLGYRRPGHLMEDISLSNEPTLLYVGVKERRQA